MNSDNAVTCLLACVVMVFGATADDKQIDRAQQAFEEADSAVWREIFHDACTDDWKNQWFLDGEVGSVSVNDQGMQLTAGPQHKNDAHHMVLWTKQSFQGDVRIEYEYTRLDFESRCVNIIYIQATGSGDEPYTEDIEQWNELRRVPSMKTYFNHMNTYHISYAANPGTDKEYIRGRRYMPNKSGLQGTELKPDYAPKGLFEPGKPHQITIIKQQSDLFMRIKNADQVYFCHFTNSELPAITEGRIGLRHIFTRSARYKNIRISGPAS